MKVNGVQQEYLPVSQGVQSDDDENQKHSVEDGNRFKNGTDEKKPGNGSLEITKDEKKEPMSPLRKFCFVLSLLQCALFIVAFGYLIPCKIPRFVDSHPGPWQYKLENNEIINTNLSYTKLNKKQGFVVFGTVLSSPNSTKYYLLALDTLDGTQAWKADLIGSPSTILCGDHLMTSTTGPPSCLTTDEGGKMGAFNLKDGKTVWYMHDHSQKQRAAPSQLTSPTIGDDCNSDSVSEIIVAGLEGKENYNLYVVSGSSGQIMTTINLTSCSNLPSHLIAWKQNALTNILLVCTDVNGFDNVWSIPMHNLCMNDSYALFQSLDINQIHNSEKDDPVIDVRLFKNKEMEDHVLIITKKGEIKRVSLESDTWKFSLPSDANFRDITAGTFINISIESVAILYGNVDETSTILMLDLASGEVLNNHSYSQPQASFVYTAENGLNEPDSLVIRNVVRVDTQAQIINVDSMTNSSKGEMFFVVDCSTNTSLVKVWDLPDSTACYGDNCSEAVNRRSSALFGDFSGNGKTSAIHAFTTLDSETNTLSTKLQAEHIFFYIPQKKCKTCSC